MSTEVIARPTLSLTALAAFLLAILTCCLAFFDSEFYLVPDAISLILSAISIRTIVRSQGQVRGWSLAVCTVVAVMLTWVITILVEGFQNVQEAGFRMKSENNLRQITLAIFAYATEHNQRLPAAAIYDASGKPMLSWRVAVLPYLDEKDLFERFHLDEPWDGPNNITLLAKMPAIYAALDGKGRQTHEPYTTCYQVFVGRGTAFEGKGGLAAKDFLDAARTFIVVEAAKPVPWTKPADLDYDPSLPVPKLGGLFRRGFNAAKADGSLEFVRKGESEAKLREATER